MTADPGTPPVPPRRVAWGPIILLCGSVVYLIGVAACMVAVVARGWMP